MGWVESQPIETLYTVLLAFAEIRAGIAQVTDQARAADLAHWLDFRVRPLFAERVVDADESVWLAMLAVLARLRAVNRTMPVTDLVFAAAAERHNLIVVTRHVRHFAGSGIRVLNPWLAAPIAELV